MLLIVYELLSNFIHSSLIRVVPSQASSLQIDPTRYLEFKLDPWLPYDTSAARGTTRVQSMLGAVLVERVGPPARAVQVQYRVFDCI